MKGTKKTVFTLVAASAITISMMSTAFAAPAKPCPKAQALQYLAAQKGVSLPVNKLNSLPINTTTPSKCPKSKAIQQLLAQYGISIPATGTTAPAPTAKPGVPATTAPAETPSPTAVPAPATGNMSADEQKMINLVNQERTNAGLNALVFDNTLRAPALKHSRDMSTNNFFSHTSPTYGSFSQRLKDSGMKYSTAGENLAMYGSVEAAHTGLMNSEGHRANIMNTNYTRIGIGIVFNQSRGTYYITQWFAK